MLTDVRSLGSHTKSRTLSQLLVLSLHLQMIALGLEPKDYLSYSLDIAKPVIQNDCGATGKVFKYGVKNF